MRPIGYLILGGLTILAASARAQFSYTGPVVARNSGVTCRGSDLISDGLFSRDVNDSGISNSSFATLPVFCPISRRSTSPYNKPGSDQNVVMSSLDIFVSRYQQFEAVTCNVYGTGQFTGGVVTSAPQSTPALTQPFGPYPATLHFDNPLNSTGQGMVNIGYTCRLPEGAMIIGSVAQFNAF